MADCGIREYTARKRSLIHRGRNVRNGKKVLKMDYKKIILEYLQNNKTAMVRERKESYARWRAWSASREKAIIVFGAKEMCEICIRYLERMEIRVDLICDNDKNCYGKLVTDNGRSIEIVSVEEAMSRYKEILCFVAAGAHHHEAISRQLEPYHITELILKWHLDFYLETVMHICYYKIPLCDKVKELLDFYEDEESLKIIWAHIAMLFPVENVPEELAAIKMESLCVKPQYFLEDGRYLQGEGIMIDCGAYIGDTLDDFLHKTKYNDFEQYDCYEMTPPTYEQLKQNLDCLPAEVRNKIHPYNVGVGETDADLRYRFNAIGGSTIMPNGETSAKIIKLDSAYKDKKVTFIKMDIEGSEQAALRGAQAVITACHPLCAICVYHSVSAFWEIPRILKQYVPEYKLILRHHTTYWDDTVCYAKTGEWE